MNKERLKILSNYYKYIIKHHNHNYSWYITIKSNNEFTWKGVCKICGNTIESYAKPKTKADYYFEKKLNKMKKR